MSTLADYRNGGEGCVLWIEENVRVPIYPPGSVFPVWTAMGELPKENNSYTKRSYWDLWQEVREVFFQALEMIDGRFKHRQIVFCWPRGEGKSFDVCLIQLWKFFCWPRQMIVLGANSKDQVKFVHYDIMRDTILNSPNLLRAIGKKNIQEKEIRRKNKEGNIVSTIRSISTASGIVSNITGYTFSEIFDMKNPKFFFQLDGSIRNIPNALGTIDSTISEKSHILYKLYETWKKKKDPYLFFSYRESVEADYRDYWHPEMTQMQLDSYRNKFTADEFDRYFKNSWDAGASKLFTNDMVEASNFIGADNALSLGQNVREIIKNKQKIEKFLDNPAANDESLISTNYANVIYARRKELDIINKRLLPLDSIYKLQDIYGLPSMASSSDLEELTELFKTDWSIGIGVDRADPMKSRSYARTILTVIAKGLPNSKDNLLPFLEEGAVCNYIYFLLHLAHIETSSLEDIKTQIKSAYYEFDGVDMICAERWGMWDLQPWCEDQAIPFEAVVPTYPRQKDCFSELFTLYRACRFKTPTVKVEGSKGPDILKEEAVVFDHDPYKKVYGSPEKEVKNGVQDDAMYSLGWGIFGMRNITVMDFRERRGVIDFGQMHRNKDLEGKYS